MVIDIQGTEGDFEKSVQFMTLGHCLCRLDHALVKEKTRE